MVCEHKKYSVDTGSGEGYCLDCGAEGKMRFVVGDEVKRLRLALEVILDAPGGGPARRIAAQALDMPNVGGKRDDD